MPKLMLVSSNFGRYNTQLGIDFDSTLPGEYSSHVLSLTTGKIYPAWKKNTKENKSFEIHTSPLMMDLCVTNRIYLTLVSLNHLISNSPIVNYNLGANLYNGTNECLKKIVPNRKSSFSIFNWSNLSGYPNNYFYSSQVINETRICKYYRSIKNQIGTIMVVADSLIFVALSTLIMSNHQVKIEGDYYSFGSPSIFTKNSMVEIEF